MNRNTALTAVFILAILGLAVAGYQTYEYHVLGSTGCSISETFSCSAVTGSQYGEFPPNSGVATAAWGVLWWLAVVALSGSLLAGARFFKQQEAYLFGISVVGVGFMLYLLTVELYILPQETGQLAICPFCTAQHVLILGVTALSYTLLPQPVHDYV